MKLVINPNFRNLSMPVPAEDILSQILEQCVVSTTSCGRSVVEVPDEYDPDIVGALVAFKAVTRWEDYVIQQEQGANAVTSTRLLRSYFDWGWQVAYCNVSA